MRAGRGGFSKRIREGGFATKGREAQNKAIGPPSQSGQKHFNQKKRGTKKLRDREEPDQRGGKSGWRSCTTSDHGSAQNGQKRGVERSDNGRGNSLVGCLGEREFFFFEAKGRLGVGGKKSAHGVET